MKTKEFNLSEKINGYDPLTQLVVKGDIKEFIKELKTESNIDFGTDFMLIKYSKFKELAGKEL